MDNQQSTFWKVSQIFAGSILNSLPRKKYIYRLLINNKTPLLFSIAFNGVLPISCSQYWCQFFYFQYVTSGSQDSKGLSRSKKFLVI